MVELALFLTAPAAGGALLYHLIRTRPHRVRQRGMAVGQIPMPLPRRRGMAVRREVVHGHH
jgi:hypothetical protein